MILQNGCFCRNLRLLVLYGSSGHIMIGLFLEKPLYWSACCSKVEASTLSNHCKRIITCKLVWRRLVPRVCVIFSSLWYCQAYFQDWLVEVVFKHACTGHAIMMSSSFFYLFLWCFVWKGMVLWHIRGGVPSRVRSTLSLTIIYRDNMSVYRTPVTGMFFAVGQLSPKTQK